MDSTIKNLVYTKHLCEMMRQSTCSNITYTLDTFDTCDKYYANIYKKNFDLRSDLRGEKREMSYSVN